MVYYQCFLSGVFNIYCWVVCFIIFILSTIWLEIKENVQANKCSIKIFLIAIIRKIYWSGIEEYRNKYQGSLKNKAKRKSTTTIAMTIIRRINKRIFKISCRHQEGKKGWKIGIKIVRYQNIFIKNDEMILAHNFLIRIFSNKNFIFDILSVARN